MPSDAARATQQNTVAEVLEMDSRFAKYKKEIDLLIAIKQLVATEDSYRDLLISFVIVVWVQNKM